MLPWTVGHLFKEGDVPSGSSIVADVPAFQANVTNRWPDGSVKFAILSGRCDLTANVARTVELSTGTANAGAVLTEANLIAAAPNVTVEVGSFGTVSLASLLGTPFRQYASGPVMSEWHYRTAVGTDPHLVVWFHVRLYAGGAIEIMPIVENGYLMVTGPTNKLARVITRVGGVAVYDSVTDLDIKHHTRFPAATGLGTIWVGTDPQVVPAHDSAYMKATKLVPNYGLTSMPDSTLNTFYQSYTPFAIANLPGNALGGTGDSASIGHLTRWESAYVCGADARAYRGVIVNALASSAYSYHMRDENTNRPLRFSDRPTLRNSELPAATGGFAYYSGQYGGAWDISHGWAPGWFAYMLTGWFYHLEELQFAVTWTYLITDPAVRGNAAAKWVMSNQIRGCAWAIRNVAMAACLTPDADPIRAEWINSLANTASWLPTYHVNGLGVFTYPNSSLFTVTGRGTVFGVWQSDYHTFSLAWARDMKLLTGSAATDLSNITDWALRGLVKRFGGGAADEWVYRFQRYESLMTATESTTFPQSAMFADWGVAFAANFGQPTSPDLLATSTAHMVNPSSPDSLANWVTERNAFDANYTSYGLCALARAVDAGVAGAAAAWARVKAASNWTTCVAGAAGDARWFVLPRT